MNQLPLLSYSPVARRADPASSHVLAALGNSIVPEVAAEVTRAIKGAS